MQSFTPFDHPEFVKYPRPESSLVAQTREGSKLLSRTILRDNFEFVEWFKDSETTIEIKASDGLVKKEVYSVNSLEETWFKTVDGKPEIVAIRRTTNGLLSDSTAPSIVIRKHLDRIYERREYWTNGVPEQVCISGPIGTWYLGRWKDGKVITDVSPSHLKLIPKKIVALWERPLVKLNATIPSVAEVKLITAEQARTMRLESLDEVIKRFNSEIEAKLITTAHARRSSELIFNVGDEATRKEFQALLKLAGYVIDTTCPLFPEHVFGVHW